MVKLTVAICLSLFAAATAAPIPETSDSLSANGTVPDAGTSNGTFIMGRFEVFSVPLLTLSYRDAI